MTSYITTHVYNMRTTEFKTHRANSVLRISYETNFVNPEPPTLLGITAGSRIHFTTDV